VRPQWQQQWRRVAIDLQWRPATPARRCASFSCRPPWPLNRWRRLRRRGRTRGPACAIERGRLLNRMPLLAIGRDHAGKDVLVRVALAAAVVPRPALLLADLGNEGHSFELLELDRASGTRLWANVVRLQTFRAIQNRLEHAAADVDGFCVPVGGACEHHVLPELATLKRSINDGELDIEHLATAVPAALEQAVLAGVARADVESDGGDRPLRDQFKLRRRCIGVVVTH